MLRARAAQNHSPRNTHDLIALIFLLFLLNFLVFRWRKISTTTKKQHRFFCTPLSTHRQQREISQIHMLKYKILIRPSRINFLQLLNFKFFKFHRNSNTHRKKSSLTQSFFREYFIKNFLEEIIRWKLENSAESTVRG